MKKFFRSNKGRLLIALFEFTLLTLIVVGVLLFMTDIGLAEDCWVMCDPDSYVCIREKPKKTSDGFGGSILGAKLETDGNEKNGYVHVINVPAEETEGWISAQHIVYDEPIRMNQKAIVVSNGRLAARKGIGGKVRTWLKPMTELTVTIYSSEWCLTNYGYVMTDYLEWVGDYGW